MQEPVYYDLREFANGLLARHVMSDTIPPAYRHTPRAADPSASSATALPQSSPSSALAPGSTGPQPIIPRVIAEVATIYRVHERLQGREITEAQAHAHVCLILTAWSKVQSELRAIAREEASRG